MQSAFFVYALSADRDASGRRSFCGVIRGLTRLQLISGENPPATRIRVSGSMLALFAACASPLKTAVSPFSKL